MPGPRKGSSTKSKAAKSEANGTEAAKSTTPTAQAPKSEAAKSKAAKSETPKSAEQPVAEQPDAAPDQTDAAAEVAVPLNRAERRAKGKAHGQVQMTGRGKVTRSTGPAAGPRMWANRRSG